MFLTHFWIGHIVAEPGPSTLGSMLMPSQETEWEKLIRLGQMTPFGTQIPQKEVKKEPRKVMLAENSAFDQYLADQAKLATERKRVPFPKKRSGITNKGSTGKKGSQSSSKDKKMSKRMRKLQITALKAHPKARPKTEPRQFKPRKKRYEGEGTESEGSEYLPSDEGIDPDQEDREAVEEGFGLGDHEEEYDLTAYKRNIEVKARKKVKKKEENEEEYSPESLDEEEDEDDKGKMKKFKDDGDVDFYKQRIRYANHALLLLRHLFIINYYLVLICSFVVGVERKAKKKKFLNLYILASK